MRIKEAARKTGLTEKTIRYYESRGLVQPDTEERNGRTWRDYTEEHVALLEAVATLRKAQFHVEEIDAILSDPGAIPEVLDKVGNRVEEAYETLGRLRSELKRESVLRAPDALTLAEELKETVKPLSLPPQDLKFNFKAQDRILAEERSRVNGAPAGAFRFGWVQIYRGQDVEKFRQIQQQLATFGVQHRASSFTKGNRLAAQGMMNAANPAYTQRSMVSPAGIQAKALSDASMDSYVIEVRKRDAEKARTALRSAG